ncbi:MAG TPA: rhomboid family intramembrane serine protease [Clostridia bacterium]|nr:rhomboid family intramembrane serine protease [Clostridia bacterium]
MNEDWRRNPDIIEGEFEIIDERDAKPKDTNRGYTKQNNTNKRRTDQGGPKGQFIKTDTKPPYVSYTLLGANIIIWLLMSFFGIIFKWDQNLQLLVFGAKVNVLVAQGQYWRLFSAMFLHIGLLHLLFNCYALYIYGPAVEKLYGKVKFTLVYIVSGLMGSLLSYTFSPRPAAGASGAIFGLLGSLLYFRKERKSLFQRAFGPGLVMIIVINLMFGFIQPGIDNWGHIGGLLGGYLMGHGLGLYKDKETEFWKKILVWLLVIFIFLIGMLFGQIKYM